MARSGGGHSGGGHSGGGHSSGGSRSGGGHSSFGGSSRSGGSRTSFGGNSRSGSGMGMGSSRGGMNGPGGMGDPGRRGMNPPPRRPRRGFFRFIPYWGGGYYRGGGCGSLMTVFIILIVLVIGLIGNIVYRYGNDTNTTTVYEDNISDDSDSHDSSHHSESSREKLDTDLIFNSSCVLDETGLVDDTETVGESLEDFFDATGVQPYVYLKSYDSSLSTESKMDDYAQDWYEDNIDNEGTFLLIYFEGRTENQDYFSYVCGYDIESVMDEDAIDVFWDYVDEYWYSESDTGDAITEIFDATANEIM
ncbi:MAG: hypothetical protein LUI14_03405 [Lachnospiraceae bacterium]|nr:hypothetical protein [Lachnospiraceae bacterium]